MDTMVIGDPVSTTAFTSCPSSKSSTEIAGTNTGPWASPLKHAWLLFW